MIGPNNSKVEIALIFIIGTLLMGIVFELLGIKPSELLHKANAESDYSDQ
jgi:hypothetical protein